MNLVLDASLVAKLLFTEPYSDTTEALVAEAGRLDWRMIAPPHMRAGVANTIRRRTRAEGKPLTHALYPLGRMLNLPILVVDPPVLYPAALQIGEAYGLSTYDALYVALARALSCDLWTDDRRVLRALSGRLPFVRWIGDYQGLVP